MSDSSSASSGGIGLGGLLFVVFLVLKLTHYIDWSWCWIFAPLYVPILFTMFLILLGLLGAAIFSR